MYLETNNEELTETQGVAEVQEVKAKKKKPFYLQTKFLVLVALCLFVGFESYAAGGAGVGGIQSATTTVGQYVVQVKGLIQAIGAVVGLIGAGRIYNKWTNGDQDINKELVGWGGACLFLVVAPQVITAFFGLATT